MKTRLNKILIISLFMSFLMIYTPFVKEVRAISLTNTFDFDSTSLGQENFTLYGSVINQTIKKSSGLIGFFEVSSTRSHSGTKSFKMGYIATEGTGQGFFNYTYDSDMLITEYSFYINIDSATSYPLMLSIYNGTLRTAGGNEILYIQFNNTHSMVALNYDHNYVQLGTYTEDIWFKFGFKINSNESVSYYINDTLIATNTPNHKVNIPRLYCFYFQPFMNAVNERFYIDDISVTISESFSGTSGGLGSCDFSDYDSKGSLTQTSYDNIYGNCVQQLYRVPIDTSIYGVEIKIANTMYVNIGADNVTDYLLYINDFPIGYPTEIISYQGGYLVRWCGSSFPVTLDNEQVLFEFIQQSKYSSFYGYWDVGEVNSDVDGDGTAEHVGTSCGRMGYNPSGCAVKDVIPKDLAYKFYYETITLQNYTPIFEDDLITTSKSSYYTFENIPIYYFVTNVTYDYQVQVWHNGSQIIDNNYPYPYDIPSGTHSGTLGYVPLHIGNYQFRLMYNGVKRRTVNVTVTTSPDGNDFVLYAYPNPCVILNSFRIGYRYYPSDGAEGLISLDPLYSATATSADEIWVLDANTSGNFTYTCDNNYWIKMYKKTGTVYYLVNSVDSVFLEIIGAFNENTLYITPGDYTIKSGSTYVTQRFHGYHQFYNKYVYILLDNFNIANVGSTQFYSFYTDITNAGIHEVKLVLETQNGTIVLATKTFGVSFESVSEGDDPFEGIFGPYKYVFSVGIIVMFLILPMTVASKLGIELPMIANLGSAALGLSFCVLTGMLPLWVIFITVIAMVVGGVVVIFTR